MIVVATAWIARVLAEKMYIEMVKRRLLNSAGTTLQLFLKTTKRGFNLGTEGN